MSEDRRNLNRPLPADPECLAALELVPAYCLGATNPAESALVEAKARTCPEVTAELAEYRLMADALLFSAPLVEPPAHVGEKLLAQIARPATQAASLPPAAPAIARTPTTMVTASQPKKLPTLPRLSAAVAAAAVILLIAANLLWSAQVNDLRREQELMNARFNEQQAALQLLGTRDSNRVELTADGGDQMYASVIWASDPTKAKWVALLYMENMPQLTPDKAYQLWLVRDDEPVSAGVFRVDENGSGAFLFESDTPIGEFDAIGITEEPAAGSPAPTSDPIASGAVELG